MRLTNLRREEIGGGARVTACVEWEDSGRPAHELYIEVSGPAAADLRASANAFLLGAFVPAFHHGERRIFVEGTICPMLRDGIVSAMMLLRSWFGPDRAVAAIEASEGFRPDEPPRERRVAAYFSGGVDSLFTIRKSMLEFPKDHPAAVAGALQVIGHDFPDPDASSWTRRHAESVQKAAASTAAEAGVEFVPVRYNLRVLEPAAEFYILQSCGASLAAAATALAGRFEKVLHPSTMAADQLVGFGNHPLLDIGYSSSALAIVHEGLAFTRFEKLRLVSQWPAGLRDLRVCNGWPIPEGFLNCGKCEKCLRTRVGLLILGRLAEAASFPPGGIAPDDIARTPGRRDFEIYWSEMIAPLLGIGRDDLARAVKSRIRLHRREQAWHRDAGWKGTLRRLDRRYLGGRLLAVRRAALRANRES